MKIKSIIINTFKESVRGRLFIAILGFSLFLLVGSRVLVPLSLGEEGKILVDIGLGSISVIGILLAILIGSQLIYNELEKKTVYFVLSKPMKRRTFIIGKYLGLLLTLSSVIVILTAWFYVVLFWMTRSHPASLLLAIFLSLLEICIIMAVSIFFSTFSSPILSSFFTFFVFIIGRLAPDIQLFASRMREPVTRSILMFIYYTVPNLNNFNVRSMVVHREPISPGFIAFAVSYALIYVTILLVISVEIFNRKDL